MSALVDMKDAWDARVRRFTKLLRRDDPTAYPPSALNTNKSSWTSEVTDALEELVDAIEELCSKNGKTLGPVEISVWKESIKRNLAEFHKFINGMEAKPADLPGPNIGPMVPSLSLSLSLSLLRNFKHNIMFRLFNIAVNQYKNRTRSMVQQK